MVPQMLQRGSFWCCCRGAGRSGILGIGTALYSSQRPDRWETGASLSDNGGAKRRNDLCRSGICCLGPWGICGHFPKSTRIFPEEKVRKTLGRVEMLKDRESRDEVSGREDGRTARVESDEA
nr:hypothetical protein CFP56_54525 [Quercus suber]